MLSKEDFGGSAAIVGHLKFKGIKLYALCFFLAYTLNAERIFVFYMSFASTARQKWTDIRWIY